MQTKFLLIFSLVLLVSISSKPDSKWKMTIKNEKGDDSPIILKKGIFTKITFIISHEDGKDFIDRSFDLNDFVIKLEDENIQTINDEYHIIPSTNLEYTTYIGLKCESKIEETEYNITFTVSDIKPLTDLNNDKNGNLEIEPVKVKIDLTPTYIELVPISTEIPQESYSLFKIKNEIYNMKKIQIKKIEDNKLFELDDIEIKLYNERNELLEDENENHGILFDFPYGTDHTFSEFKNNTNFTYTLQIEKDECSGYFELTENSKSLTLTVYEKEESKLTDAEKEAIISSVENITPKKDETSNIQLEILIPVDSVIIECKLDNDDEKVSYKNYVKDAGKYVIKFDDLVSITEYKAECKFTTLNKDSSSVDIKIGNFRDADVVTQLIPSRKLNQTPQCVEFIFSNNENVKEFSSLAEKYCLKIMTKGEKILSRIMGSIKCEEIKKLDNIKLNSLNKTMICAGPTPSFKSEKFREIIIKDDENYFNEQFDQFVSNLNSTEKIKELFELENIELSNINRYYDEIAPDKEKIVLEVETENGMKKRNKLKFNITSYNLQPIECYYNQKLKHDDKKKYISLKGENSIILNGEGDTKSFEVNLSDQKKNDMFALYLICYNLPGFNIRYESTGIFNAYTYLYTDDIENQPVNKKEKVTINCAEKIIK